MRKQGSWEEDVARQIQAGEPVDKAVVKRFIRLVSDKVYLHQSVSKNVKKAVCLALLDNMDGRPKAKHKEDLDWVIAELERKRIRNN